MVPIDIDCVDATGKDAVPMIARQRYPRALRVQTVGHLVRQVLARLGPDGGIRRLRIFGHGAPGYQGLGNSQARPPEFPYRGIYLSPGGSTLMYSDLLGQLTERFLRNEPALERLGRQLVPMGQRQTGWAELHGCNVGTWPQGPRLLQALAALWRVRVSGGEGYQILQPGFEGYYLVAHPDGKVEQRYGTAVRTMST